MGKVECRDNSRSLQTYVCSVMRGWISCSIKTNAKWESLAVHRDLTFSCKQTLVAVIWSIICQVRFNQHFRQWDVCTNVRLCNSELWLIIKATWSWCLHGPYSLYGWSKYGKVSKTEQAHLVVKSSFPSWECAQHVSPKGPGRVQEYPTSWPCRQGNKHHLPYIESSSSNLPDLPSAEQYWPVGFWVQFLLLLRVSWHVYSASN